MMKMIKIKGSSGSGFSIRKAERMPRRVAEELAFTDVGDIAALVSELHHSFALAGSRRPAGTSVRILFDTAETEGFVVEIDRA
jgi:hypothetical protein